MRILLAPIMITPTKPLTPSHLKALLWLDALWKATATLHDVNCELNRRTCDITLQTCGFWAFLDQQYPNIDYQKENETSIGHRYVEYHKQSSHLDLERVLRYRNMTDQEGWLHPAGMRILQDWQKHLNILQLDNISRYTNSVLPLTAEAVINILKERDCLLDLRKLEAGAYLDFTEQGIPLRRIVDNTAVDNYIICVLRELLHKAAQYDLTLLMYDNALDTDYMLIEKVLNICGAKTKRLSLGRVPLDGITQSSRAGGWENYSLENLYKTYRAEYGEDAVRLGLRIYFIADLCRNSNKSFSFSGLEKAYAKAAKLLALNIVPAPALEFKNMLSQSARKTGYVNPYNIVAKLYSKKIDKFAGSIINTLL